MPTASAATPSGDAISIKSISTRYDSDFETFHVFGEVRNSLKIPVQNTRLNVTFYNTQGNLTGAIVGSPFFSDLAAGENSAFDIVAQGEQAAAFRNFAYYKIARSWDEAAEQRQGLLRLDLREVSRDDCGYYRIQGTVSNGAKEHTSGISISAAFYNEQNQIVSTAYTTISDRLDPTKSAPFTLVIEGDALPHFAYYSFNVQSDEYTAARVEGQEDLSNFHSLAPIGGKLMTVATRNQTYSVDDDKVSLTGFIPPEEVKKRGENTIVVLKVMTGAGLVPAQVTAPVKKDGSFSREFEYQMDEAMEGQVLRIRAEYFGMIAESTFSVSGSSPGGSGQQCDAIKRVEISELKAGTEGSTSQGNVTDFFSAKQFGLGSDVELATTLSYLPSRIQNVTIVTEAFDSTGVVVFIHAGECSLSPNTGGEALVSWHPVAPGTYVVKTFALSSLYEPEVLSQGPALSIKVVPVD